MHTPTPQTYQQLRQLVTSTRFPQHTQEIQSILEAAFKQIADNLENPYFLHKGTRPTRQAFGAPLPNGQRDETMLRHFITAELFRAWVMAYGQVPVINNKGYPATEFVRFAEQVFYLLGIGKIEDHLEEFQSFRATSLKNSEMK